MLKRNDQYYYPLREAENPNRLKHVEVCYSIYAELKPECDRVRKRNQRSGQCVCPKRKFMECNLECDVCPHKKWSSKEVSLEKPIQKCDRIALRNTLAAPADNPEKALICKEAMLKLTQIIDNLNEDERNILSLMFYVCYTQDKRNGVPRFTQNNAAKELNMPPTTFKRHWETLRQKIRAELGNYTLSDFYILGAPVSLFSELPEFKKAF